MAGNTSANILSIDYTYLGVLPGTPRSGFLRFTFLSPVPPPQEQGQRLLSVL